MHCDRILNEVELQRKNENKDGKWCIMTVFEFERFWTFMSRLASDHLHPHWPSVFIAFFGTLLFWLLENVVGPRLQDLHVASE